MHASRKLDTSYVYVTTWHTYVRRAGGEDAGKNSQTGKKDDSPFAAEGGGRRRAPHRRAAARLGP